MSGGERVSLPELQMQLHERRHSEALLGPTRYDGVLENG